MTDFVKLRDFYASAYILAKMKGSELVSYIRENGATTFIFKNSQELQRHLNDYFSLKGVVEPFSYSSSIKNLKTLIHLGRSEEVKQQLSTFSDRDLNNDFSNNTGENF